MTTKAIIYSQTYHVNYTHKTKKLTSKIILQIFNVKQAVLSWLSNSPNLGLLVTASTIFGDRATVNFSRRGDESHNKQPILVLFNNDNQVNDQQPEVINIEEEKDELDEITLERKRRHTEGEFELVPEYEENNRPIYFHREKKGRRSHVDRDENAIVIPRRHDSEYFHILSIY